MVAAYDRVLPFVTSTKTIAVTMTMVVLTAASNGTFDFLQQEGDEVNIFFYCKDDEVTDWCASQGWPPPPGDSADSGEGVGVEGYDNEAP